MNSAELNGRQLHLRIDREGETDPEGSSSIYVGNLPWQVTEAELKSAFAIYKPYFCSVMKNMSGRSRGFAILKFHREEDSQLAIESMHKTEIGGRAIEVSERSRFFLHASDEYDTIYLHLAAITCNLLQVPPLNIEMKCNHIAIYILITVS